MQYHISKSLFRINNVYSRGVKCNKEGESVNSERVKRNKVNESVNSEGVKCNKVNESVNSRQIMLIPDNVYSIPDKEATITRKNGMSFSKEVSQYYKVAFLCALFFSAP